jgi:ABC-type molybdate transport system permease subunit
MLPRNQQINSKTQRAHKWQVFWQISVPLAAGILLAIFLLALSLRSGEGSIERSAQLATIALSLPIMVIGLVLLIAMIFLGFVVGRFMKWLPPHTNRAQKFAQKVSTGISHATDLSRQPFLALESWAEAFDRVIHRRG